MCVCLSGGVCLPGHCVGRDSHYGLTVMVTSSDTLRLLSGELAVDRRWDVQRLCDIVHLLHCPFFKTLYTLSTYVCTCVIVFLCCCINTCV